MSISVLLEPKAGGFRASMNSPVALTADGRTEDEALDAIRVAFDARLSSGARIVDLPVTRVDDILKAARAVGEDPLFEEYLKILEENRRVSNAVPDSPE